MTVGRKSQVALSSASISLHPPVASDSCKVPMGVTNKATTAARLLIEREREREEKREREREGGRRYRGIPARPGDKIGAAVSSQNS